MATKKRAKVTRKKAVSKSAASKSAASKSAAGIKVRMYRQGLGDCFLITLPRKGDDPYYIMIDCGVILGTQDASTKMKRVVSDIIATTKGHINLLLATHEHWDHVSGFNQAKELFAGLRVDDVWVAWTEDPKDKLARSLRAEHQALRLAVTSACARMRFGGAPSSAADTLMEFFGAAGQGSTGDALKIVKGLVKGKDPRYCLPSDDPVEVEGTGVRLYVLGPPHDEKEIKRFNPSKSHPETYGLAKLNMDKLTPGITNADLDAPFDPIVQIPLQAAGQMPFFRNRYWGEDADSEEKDQSWRRIDGDWLDSCSSMALQLDSATNNTSLVLAMELESGDVLLFVADAQVGNWLSWHDLKWDVGGKSVTGPDLLRRTVLYKTGHHGSHNATLKELGLELMTNLKTALIPVDHEMALKKRWGKMPLDDIEKRLIAKTRGRVLRIDKEIPPALAGQVEENAEKDLYYEVSV